MDDGDLADLPDDDSGLFDCECWQCDAAKLALFVFGTIGNVISLLVMRQQAMNARSYIFSLAVLTVFNSLTLFAHAVEVVDKFLAKYQLSFEPFIGDIGCKIYRMLPRILEMGSHWFVVVVTTERFCAVCFPFLSLGKRFAHIPVKRIALGSLFVVVVVSQSWRLAFDYQIPAHEEEEIVSENLTRKTPIPAECSAKDLALYFVIENFVNQLLLVFLLPAVCIICLNSATAWHIWRAGHDIRKMRDQSARGSLRQGRLRSLPHFAAYLAGQAVPADSTPPVKTKFDWKRRKFGSTPAALSVNSKKVTDYLTKYRTRKSTALLFALTGCFVVCMMPQLTLLLYLRVSHLLYGHEESFKTFIKVCQPLNVSSVLTAMNYADNFVIFMVAGKTFRKSLAAYLRSNPALKHCCPSRLLSFCFGEEVKDLRRQSCVDSYAATRRNSSVVVQNRRYYSVACRPTMSTLPESVADSDTTEQPRSSHCQLLPINSSETNGDASHITTDVIEEEILPE